MTAFDSFAFAVSGSSTARTLPDRLSDVANVKDWGAKGDGIQDDSSFIQAAINYAVNTATAGKYVYFPAGTYFTGTTAIDLSPFVEGTIKSISIVGAGRNATIIKGAVHTGNPPFGSTQWQSGVVPSDSLPASAVVWSSHGAGHIALMADMTIWNTSTADQWCFAAVLGYFQPITTFRNLRFKGMSGAMFNEAYGIVVQDCVAESISSLTADQAARDPNLDQTSVVWNPPGNHFNPNVGCYTGTVGIGVNQGETTACHVIGPFDVGLAVCGIGMNVRGCKVERCGIGLWKAMSAGGESSVYVNTGQCGAGMMGACVFDRCLIGVYGKSGSLSLVASVISGTQGPATPAPLTLSYDGATHVVTATTAVNHRIGASGPLYLSVPSDWLSTTDRVDGIVSATVGAPLGPNQFTYAGPTSAPTTLPGTGAWNYPIQQAMRLISCDHALLAGNALSAIASDASVEVGRSVLIDSNIMATEGRYGWKEFNTDPFIRYLAGLRFVGCGTAGSNRLSSVSANPLIPTLKFINLPNVQLSDLAPGEPIFIYNPPEAFAIGQQYWITDGTPTSIGSPVGGFLFLSSSAAAGATVLNFASVPSWVVANMKVQSHREFGTHLDPINIYGGCHVVGSPTSTQVVINPGTNVAIAAGASVIFGGGGNNKYLVRFDGTNWIRIA